MKIDRPISKQPIPPDAKLVFKGVIFDVYQWEQELFDGTKATFEKLKRRDTIDVIPVTEDGKILILEERHPNREPFFSFPGGGAYDGEDPVAVAKRELMEESGYEFQDLTLWRAEQPVGKIEWAVYAFIGHGCKKTREPNPDAGEKIRVFLVSFEEFLDMAAEGKFYEAMTIEGLKAKSDPKRLQEMKKLFGIS